MINNYHLKYFLDAVQAKSQTKAAQKNYVSVAAISQAIKNIEKEINFSLFYHQKNQLNLTPQGTLFYEKAQKYFTEVESFHNDINQKDNQINGKITFATQQSLASIILPDLLFQAQQKLPEVKSSFKMGITKYVKSWVEDGDVDFGISLDNVKYLNCHASPLFSGNFICIKKKKYSGPIQFLVTEETKELIKLRRSYKKEFKSPLPESMSIGSWGVIAKMALKGFGIGFIPDYYLRELDKSQYSIHRMPFDLPKYTINIYTLKSKPQNSVNDFFINELISLSKKIKLKA